MGALVSKGLFVFQPKGDRSELMTSQRAPKFVVWLSAEITFKGKVEGS